MNGTDLPPGSTPVVKINGELIRRLRESKGLTQLYVATCVGVTTDTISRWENRRYPTIKKENGLKLAEALGVSLPEIEDAAPGTPASGPVESTEAHKPPAPRRRLLNLTRWLVPPLLLFGVLAAVLRFVAAPPRDQAATVLATRILPPHTAPGQPFPVLIRITGHGDPPQSLLIRESLPSDCLVESGSPPFTGLDKERRAIKWIAKTAPGTTTFAYLVRPLAELQSGHRLTFSGNLTRRKTENIATTITGSETLTISNHHWADTNADKLIDDEEILAVYDNFGGITGLDFDKELIDEIWSGSGYQWEPEQQRFIINP